MNTTTTTTRLIFKLARTIRQGDEPDDHEVAALGRAAMQAAAPSWAWEAAELHFGNCRWSIREIARETKRAKSTVHEAVNKCYSVASELRCVPDHWERTPEGRRPQATEYGSEGVLHDAGMNGKRHNGRVMVDRTGIELPDEEPDV